MRNYIFGSFAVHALVIVILVLTVKPAPQARMQKNYTISFIGAQQMVAPKAAAAPPQETKAPAKAQEPAPAPAAPKPTPKNPPPAPDTIPETKSVKNAPKQTPKPKTAQPAKQAAKATPSPKPAAPKKEERIVLGAPSILKGVTTVYDQPAQAGTASVPDAQAAHGVTADFPDFPYPWYITQVRNMLWTQWSSRQTKGGGNSVLIKFKILKNGTIEKVEVQKTSGNRLFDYAAMTSVNAIESFPPLPTDYRDEFLNAHVEFKSALE